MANRICIIDGCVKDGRAGRGWCWTHYSRWRAHGTTELPIVENPCKVPGCVIVDLDTCHFPNCGRKYYARGVCNGHAQQLSKLGVLSPLREKRANGANVGKVCEFAGCVKPQIARGLCGAHAVQRRSGKDLKPLRRATARDGLGRKRCPACDEWLEVSQFSKSKVRVDGLASACRGCVHRRSRRALLARYNVTLEWYEEQLRAQGDGCAICATPPGRKMLSIDHDHSCCPGKLSCGSCVRGLLCFHCNSTLGRFNDSQTRLRAAADYLDRPPNATPPKSPSRHPA
jgi:hypothetical protein